MKKTLLAATLSAIASTASAQDLYFAMGTTRDFLMATPSNAVYVEGTSIVQMRDGIIFLAPCFHPVPILVFPNIACPLGTTGFIIQGDIDGDGISDDRSYWSVDSFIVNSIVDSFRAEDIVLFSAPISKLERPFTGFRDSSVSLFYNMLQPELFIRRYDVASYIYTREYSSLSLANPYKTHSEEWVPGKYIFQVPLKDQPLIKVPINMSILPMTEANGYKKGVKGFELITSTWALGAMDLDPRLLTTIKWKGNTGSNTYSSDTHLFSMSDDLDFIVYPAPDTRYALNSPFLTSLTVLPFVFQKGDVGTCRLDFERNLTITAITRDISERSWIWNARFIDSWRGHDLYEFRNASDLAIPGIKVAGNPSKLRAPNADYDGDGLSNIMEFAYSQDDGDDVSSSLEWTSYHNDPMLQPTPTELLALGLTAPTTAPPAYLDTLNAGIVTTPYVTNKRANVGGSITYGYEICYNTAATKPKWVALKGPKPGESVVIKDKTAGNLAVPANPNFTWTITDVIVNTPALGTTTIQASNALPATVRIRSTAAVTKGY
jgi:hypothetical protein